MQPAPIRAADRRRAIVEGVTPSVDGGRYAVKRCVGDSIIVEADAFVDGHDGMRCVLQWRRVGDRRWQEAEMSPLGNDRWRGRFDVAAMGAYEYTVAAWPDALETWRHDLARWESPADIGVALAVGAQIVAAAAARASGNDAKRLKAWSAALGAVDGDPLLHRAEALASMTISLAARHAERSHITVFEPVLRVDVEPQHARYSTWYEMFPRSAAGDGRHGTFRDCTARLPYVESMGFDVLYFPPIHPIGHTQRKGRNNALVAGDDDPGSPWAIGSEKGGHKEIHPALGTLDDFHELVSRAQAAGIRIALDLAFQCSPDHPYVREHPDWFRRRPDGSTQFAENPPKKYEDIYPLDFGTGDWEALWQELLGVVQHWIEHGVRIFRVDNPHTKPFRMWQWLIARVRRTHPDVIFLSEAFTRPKVMHALAKAGFSQSYTYFTWRNSKAELTEYFTELTQRDAREYFRPNVWPNTPDILAGSLQNATRPAFMIRVILAATLSASYGIYGPAYELLDNRPRGIGEEYLDSEKYEIREWDLARPASLRTLIARLNGARRAHPSLQQDSTLRFFDTDNAQLICYAKTTEDLRDVVLTIVNLDARYAQSGWVTLALESLGLRDDTPFKLHDLLSSATYEWRGSRNYVRLDPQTCPAHVFHVEAAAHQPGHDRP